MAAELHVDADTFWSRLARWHSLWSRSREQHWGGADAVCLALPKFDDEQERPTYSKSAAMSRSIVGYELSSTVMLLTKTELHVLSGEKKCALLEGVQGAAAAASCPVKLVLHRTSKGGNDVAFGELIKAAKASLRGARLGILAKELENFPGVAGNVALAFLDAVDKAGLQKVEVNVGCAAVLAEKDSGSVDHLKKAAVMSNKVMKHVFIKTMEEVFDDSSRTKTHSEMATEIDEKIEDPSKLGIKVPPGSIDSCFFPIVQSGGSESGFSLKASAQTDDNTMTEDVVICSLGASFKGYCGHIARTFCIDPVPKVQSTYATLLKLRAECLTVMTNGGKLADVHIRAKEFLAKKHPALAKHLPRSLGFSLGIEFKDSVYSFTAKTDPQLRFRKDMVFSLSVGFQDVPLSAGDRKSTKGPLKKLEKFSLLVADTVRIAEEGSLPDVLTKTPCQWTDVSYNILNDADQDEESEDGEGDEEEEEEADEGTRVKTAAGVATVLKSRLRERNVVADEVTAARQKRMDKQTRLHQAKIDKGLRDQSRGGGGGAAEEEEEILADEFASYPSSERFPPDANGSTIHVDMERECIFLPINGQPVPFHISTIKNVVMPDPDRSTYLRINFYTPGQALGKDAPKQMAAIVDRHKQQGGEYAFIKEFTFRCVEQRGLNKAFREIQELRKRSRQREARQLEEADLVVQAKLVKMRDCPRLADLEMRPALSGRKSKGNLEAHSNGLRFVVTKSGESVDMMYANIKHALFQPCKGEHLIVIHFNLVHPIMVGKKKTQDVQFITEVVEASEDVNARNSVYDPDEYEQEQRERKMRKKLNLKFKDFVMRVEDVAKQHDLKLEFDMPYRDLAFQGAHHREMVTLMPSINCLCNLTEMPPFVLSMREVDHVHFERCSMGNKNFDMVFVMKNLNQPTPTRMISAIDMKDIDEIQEWLSNQDITYTGGTINFNWKNMITTIKGLLEDGVFWEQEVEENGELIREPGYLFLNADNGDDEGEDEDEDGEEYEAGSDDEESEDYDDEDDEDDDFDEEEDESEFDEEEEDDAEGQDWDELEAEAIASDRQKEDWERQQPEERPAKKSRRR
eukprot:CAMPEP_0118980332 /NCGR_PEP_ID=MMETSP1173-20130426/28059_1 /TAXON_ID=1034831 /ORGANISM="Rhizochromulina marina cf, Strain CCMP1243" /LENGTH=1081 /DNA_ID=CAMNT_0006930669 /DNA_START=32 /DNA_END=3277 /DNA_ORIENTATION=+